LEHYDIGAVLVLHLDLYRIADPGELEYLGITDLLDPGTVLLVEWPERGSGYLPEPDLTIEFERAELDRQLRVYSHTSHGASICQTLADLMQ